jgi:DNA-binding NarL/FixJ family response regulator
MCLIVQTWRPSLTYTWHRRVVPPPAWPRRRGDVPVPAKILVVDDQQFVRRTLCSMLSQQSHWKIYEAENGKVALEQIREITPDVAVLDIMMPEMSGIEAAYEIRQHTPQTKVILISSHYTPEEAAMLARLFADGAFVQKSEADKELVPAISRLLPKKRQAH